MLWDEGSWEPKGDPTPDCIKATYRSPLYGERLKGDWDLIRMRGDGKRENWLLIKAKDAEADQGKNGDFLDDQSFSIKTGRSMDEIAGGEVSASTKKKRAQSRDGGLENCCSFILRSSWPTLVDQPPQGAEWLHEIKLDGYPALGLCRRNCSLLAHAQRQGLDSQVSVSRCLARKAQGHRCRTGYGSRRRQ